MKTPPARFADGFGWFVAASLRYPKIAPAVVGANQTTLADLGYDLAMPTFTVEQVRAARAFLGWTQADLGDAAGLSFQTIRNFETSRFPLSPPNRNAVRKAFKKAGVEFIKRGKRIGVTIPVHQQRR